MSPKAQALLDREEALLRALETALDQGRAHTKRTQDLHAELLLVLDALNNTRLTSDQRSTRYLLGLKLARVLPRL